MRCSHTSPHSAWSGGYERESLFVKTYFSTKAVQLAIIWNMNANNKGQYEEIEINRYGLN